MSWTQGDRVSKDLQGGGIRIYGGGKLEVLQESKGDGKGGYGMGNCVKNGDWLVNRKVYKYTVRKVISSNWRCQMFHCLSLTCL